MLNVMYLSIIIIINGHNDWPVHNQYLNHHFLNHDLGIERD